MPRAIGLISEGGMRLNRSLIEAWASVKSYRLTGGKNGNEIGRPGIRVVAQR